MTILPDNDEAGEDHAQKVCQALIGIAKAVRVVRLPGLPKSGDVRDWLGAHSRRELMYELASQEAER